MKKLILQSFIIATCADIFAGLVLVTIYCLKHPPFDWGLFRFGLIMGYLQQVIIIIPVLLFCKILLAKFSRFYYYLLLSVLYCTVRLMIYPMIVPSDIYGIILELFSIIGFDLLLSDWRRSPDL
jgi:hypothetical protein